MRLVGRLLFRIALIALQAGLGVGFAAATFAATAGESARVEPDRHASRGEQAEDLVFADGGKELVRMPQAALLRSCKARVIEIDDPYYHRRMRFHACALREVMALGFGSGVMSFADRDFVLRARDGYAKTTTGARLLEEGGWLAFSDADRGTAAAPAWDPIDRRQVDPSPYYLVWSKPEQLDTHRYPWPYQLVRLELVSIERDFPKAVPAGVASDSAPSRGFAIFRRECLACHAINGQGGKVGPELNLPQSIVEYRPIDQIKAYIRDPQTFRYTSMPSHAHLSAGDLDDLVAYFQTMKTQKQDSGGK